MLTIVEGIQKAREHLAVILPDLNEDLQIEELETPPHGSKWRFTFTGSFSFPSPLQGMSLNKIMSTRRIAKSVEIDPETGDLLAVKNVAA